MELIRKIQFGSTFDRFDANISPHYHFICESCGLIRDLALPIQQNLNLLVNSSTPYKASRHRIEFYGLCENCS